MTLRDRFLPFCLPSVGEEEIAEVVDSLKSGWLTTGPKTKRFEQDFAQYTGSKHALAVNSCTAALHVSLSAIGVGAGAEVIVPTLTFCSTANVVVHTGARPVLVDVREDFTADPERIEAAITAKTRAIIPVHFAGLPCDMEAILDIGRRHNIPVIEDAAHAAGAEYHGRRVGSQGLATCFSFYAIKNMTTGEGGMITLDDDKLAERMRLFVLHGMNKDAWKRYSEGGSWYYEVLLPGYKYNMTDIQAALGIHQLKRLEDFIGRREQIVQRYREGLKDFEELILPPVPPADVQHAWHLFVIRLKLDALSISRAAFIARLAEAGIGTSVHFVPVHLHPYYQEEFSYQAGQFPVAERVYESAVSLPLYPALADTDVDRVIGAVGAIVEENRR